MTTTTLQVKGMMCNGCEDTVTKAVRALPGVVEVSASHVSGEVKVTHEDGGPDPEAIKVAIDGAGYEASLPG